MGNIDHQITTSLDKNPTVDDQNMAQKGHIPSQPVYRTDQETFVTPSTTPGKSTLRMVQNQSHMTSQNESPNWHNKDDITNQMYSTQKSSRRSQGSERQKSITTIDDDEDISFCIVQNTNTIETPQNRCVTFSNEAFKENIAPNNSDLADQYDDLRGTLMDKHINTPTPNKKFPNSRNSKERNVQPPRNPTPTPRPSLPSPYDHITDADQQQHRQRMTENPIEWTNDGRPNNSFRSNEIPSVS
jgi:hypothetical protein